MSSIFFYVFIYFVGYYGSNILNMFTIRPLVTNRYIAALIPVFCIAMLHGYKITTTPPKSGAQDVTVESALFLNIVMPVLIVTLGAIYFMWNSNQEEDDENKASEEDDDDDDDDEIESLESRKKSSDTLTSQGEESAPASEASQTGSSEDGANVSETEKKNKDA